MTDGLEIVEIHYSDLEKTKTVRIDNEYFLKEYIQNEKRLDRFGYKQIGDIVDQITDFGAYSQTNFIDLQETGINFFRNQDVKNNAIDSRNCAKIGKKAYDRLTLKLQLHDILLPRTGTLGNAGVITQEHLPASANQNLAVLRNVKELLPQFISVVLCSKVGKLQVNRTSTGNVQQWLNLDAIKGIKIPDATIGFQNTVKRMVLYSEELLRESERLYLLAEKMLTDHVNVSISETGQKNNSVKFFSDSYGISGRLDAEYYQPKYAQIESAIMQGEYTTLDSVSDIDSGEFISESLYGDVGISYIRGTEITSSMIDHENATKVDVNAVGLKTLATGDLAFAMIGSVGNVSINRGPTAIVSNNLGTIKPHDKKLSHYLLVYLSSDIGQALFEKYQTRTAQPKIRKEDVGNFLIPILPDSDIEDISAKVNESFTLKERSKHLLELAVKIVELAIETDEETALAWLDRVAEKNGTRVDFRV